MKPPIAYFGGKTALADRLVDLMPAHEGYVEPYAGSLAVLLAKPQERVEVVNDLDRRLVTFWRVLRDHPDELLRRCALTPHSRAELDYAQDFDVDDEIELARRVWVVLTQGRSRHLGRTGWRFFANPANSPAGFPANLDTYRERLSAAAERIRLVTLECRPAVQVIEQYGAAPGNLLYVDPPYLGSTRSGWDRYPEEMRDEAGHREMAAALQEVAGPVLVSGYASDLYDRELFPDWDRIEIGTFSANAVDRVRTEVVWSNRPMGAFLFDL